MKTYINIAVRIIKVPRTMGRYFLRGGDKIHIRFNLMLLPILLIVLFNSCITEFVPEVSENKSLLVIEGLITDQPEPNLIKISRSMPLGKKSELRPVSGCTVRISDDLGHSWLLEEAGAGRYFTSPSLFQGEAGRSYTLHVSLLRGSKIINYQSFAAEMRPVPPIDSLYYEKKIIQNKTQNDPEKDGCIIYFDTHDPENKCKLFRWDFTETWMIRIPYPVQNMKCWITESSKTIDLKSTDALSETSIKRYPINYIDATTDRLRFTYSLMLDQYSLNEDEFTYWEKLQKLTDKTGGLYDIIPSDIPSNIQCVDYPDETVLGYFSVSGKSSKRIFIKDDFKGTHDPYANCLSRKIIGDGTDLIPYLNVDVWVLFIQPHSFPDPGYVLLTKDYGCVDCTVRGSNIKPAFWPDDK